IECRTTPSAIEPLSAPELPYLLEELGLITLGEALHPGLRILELTSRNVTFRVCRAQGGGFFIKQPRHIGAATIAKIHGEAAVTGHLSGAGLEGLPALLAVDSRCAALVYELVEGRHLGLGEGDPAHHFRQLGATLARLHRINAGAELPVSDLPVLARPEGWREMGASSPVALAVLARDRAIREGFDWLADSWRGDAIIHGDIKPSNVMVGADGAIRLIDWELGGLGDPRWDLGMAAGYLLSEAIYAHILRDDERPLSDCLSSAREMTAVLLDGYRAQASGKAMEAISASGLGRATALAIAQFVLALGRGAQRPTQAMIRLTQIALNLLARPADGLRTLVGEWPA
ncbi:MAG: aminoglycoside phosphotransferase family protein, partial [Azospirillaceae bacterium]